MTRRLCPPRSMLRMGHAIPMALVAGLACLSGLAAPAAGDWPSDPASPLELGDVLGITAGQLATAVTPDGATWVAWVDVECFGALRVQRIDPNGTLLRPGGLSLDPVNTCVFRTARLASCADGSILACAVAGGVNSSGQLGDMPVHRVAPDGTSLWGEGVVVASNAFGNIGELLELPGGDVLIAWHAGMNVFVSRFAADGSPVWPEPASTAVPHGPTMRIFGMVPDEEGGVFVFWDTPGPYTRAVFATRFTAEGVAAWPSPVHLTAITPGSMHSAPAAIEDGEGSAVVVWKEGIEQSTLPAPLVAQRIFPDGSLAFDPAGLRVSLDDTAQFDPLLARDLASGDLLIAWRDLGATLHAQRLTLAGDRLWGDSGVVVTSIGFQSAFHGLWDGEGLMIAIARFDFPAGSEPRVHVHRVDGSGAVLPDAVPVSGPSPAAGVRLSPLEDGVAITWCSDAPGFPDDVVAQRLNPDGTLGSPGQLVGDLDGDGAVNGADLGLLLGEWGAKDAAADLNKDGVVDGADLGILLGAWTE